MGGTILFVYLLAGLAIWIVEFSSFVVYYVLTTLIETSAGNDVVEYPYETWLDRAWKPIMLLWVFSVWCVPISLLCLPLASSGFWPFVTAFAIGLSVIFPLSLVSILYRQSWLILLDATVVWRMLRHFRAFLYVLGVTLSLMALCVTLFIASATHGWIWLALFTVLTPMSMLLWARHWGRLAWLTMNDMPSSRKRKGRRKKREVPVDDKTEPPEVDVEVVAEADSPTPGDEIEEDEWATDKAPYATVGHEAEASTEGSSAGSGQAVPFSIVAYYEKRAASEAKVKEERESAVRTVASAWLQPPSFRAAMFVGVWSFPFQRRAIVAWMNLAVLTLIGVLLLAMLGVFRPPV